ncbi:acetoin utilization protein AcuC [Weizmannia acidilactici]|uniref:Acetoin utilization protein AcuC n=1 Tax=Weizmannia acidilactici TaxID=2607726 RepID=A0A5J4JKC5_9BACI|nr:acetoin utilization protein AcuC [Weizmannia acidilactici]GER66440.1 acetoin utilization protein AcuC [Weizmannia acidilactici]GER69414.1 acetoin utilization protein AcuC [Weizmannia acidilactici]GER72258.1 acetoin utilization protein AcuC [Weizmannia acidilactici]
MKEAVFVFSTDLLAYRFRNDHPFNQMRLQLVKELLEAIGALNREDIVKPRMASDEELFFIHDPSYVEAVKLAGRGKLDPVKAENFGLGTEDTPIFPNMHEASALIAGGTLAAAEEVMSGRARHALHLGGGLHHGFRGKASGFCIYNDTAIAIKYLRETYGVRILYVDTDAHHGDGVQWAFYDDENVCTLSIHETGRYLFPGTGNVNEWGTGKGYGYSFNIPVDAFTEDESWLECYAAALEEIAAYFKPDVLVTQNGADAHYYDPLTHLSATMKIYREIPKLAHKIAHQYCEGRWIAVGGGGYDIWRVVPRAWSLLWLEMAERDGGQGEIPASWLEKWQKKSSYPLPAVWDDPADLYRPIPRKQEIEEKNRNVLNRMLQFIGQLK